VEVMAGTALRWRERRREKRDVREREK